MDYSLIFENFSIIIASLGGWVLITYLGSKYLSERIADKMLIKWKSKEDKKLEQLRSEIQKEHMIFSSILTSFSSIQQNNYPEKITAIKDLWSCVLSVRESASLPMICYDTFMEDEYSKPQNDSKINAWFQHFITDDFMSEGNEIRAKAELNRPFLGERLWFSFEMYDHFVGRSKVLLWNGYDLNNIICWHKDSMIKSILNQTFTENEIKEVCSGKIESFRKAKNIFENYILLEIVKMTSGDLEGANIFESLRHTRELAQKINSDEKI